VDLDGAVEGERANAPAVEAVRDAGGDGVDVLTIPGRSPLWVSVLEYSGAVPPFERVWVFDAHRLESAVSLAVWQAVRFW
jgi:hypothetical protein